MSTESINVAELARSVARLLDWRLTDGASIWQAEIQRADGLAITIADRSKKKPVVDVYVNLNGMKGVSPGQVKEISTKYSVLCTPNVSAVVSAIRSRILPEADADYRAVIENINHAEHIRLTKIAIMEELAWRLHTEVQGSGGYEQRCRELIEQGEGEISYHLNDLWLYFKASGDGRSFRLTGYTNSIPVDLMWRLIPVIDAWQAEQSAKLV